MNYVGNLLPFVFRRSKSISTLVQALVLKMHLETNEAQTYIVSLMEAGKYKGQFQVVSERIREVFRDDRIRIEDGSDGNILVVGRKSPYVRVMGLDRDRAFISLPMNRTTVGIDFIVYVPTELERRESEIIAWLNSIVLAGVGFEIKYV